jgi:hypothetical protein
MNAARTIGLILFVALVGPAFPVLLVDFGLGYAGGVESTISYYCWYHPQLGVSLISALFLGVAGLAVHLWPKPSNR